MLLNIFLKLTEYLWSFPMLVILMGTHLYFTLRLGIIQRKIPQGIRLSFSKKALGETGISPYAALTTALAATIGTGNIIGISTAIAIGGPGAVFWCWLTGLFGIATCYGECFLSVKYRRKQTDGSFLGGPMYVLKFILQQKGLAAVFAVFCILGAFSMGAGVQAHSIRLAILGEMSLSPHLIGMGIALLAGVVLIGGVKQISKVCMFFVPIMSLFYLLACAMLLFLNREYLLPACSLIIKSAFAPQPLLGGVCGTAVLTAIRIGTSRGLFTNEAGLGSIPMAAATANAPSPKAQALVSMTGPFWDTVVICAVTGLVIVSSMIKHPGLFAGLAGERFCFQAFSELPFHGEEILSLSLVLFAFATILGWCYYGECGVRFLFGTGGLKSYQLGYLLFLYLGAVMPLSAVWGISDFINIGMTVPNLFCLWRLRKEIMV
ncbi:transporter [Clostridia bacterium]|nr:transporter [Clostridia bacterium]